MRKLGILAVLLLLCSPTKGNPVTVEPEVVISSLSTDANATTTNGTTEEFGLLKQIAVRDLPFAPNLKSCPADPPPGSPNMLVAEERRAEFASEFYRTISENANRYRLDGQEVLNSNMIHDCLTLNVPLLDNLPTVKELEVMNHSEALVRIYSSIVHHIAHAYFIRHQYEEHGNISCSTQIENENTVSRKSELLAVKQKFLACFIRMGASAMGYTQNYNAIVEDVLNENLTVLEACSRRVLRDCQVFRSTVHLLEVVTAFASNNYYQDQY